ncbi:hypothetical protein [Piscinibacter sakaiensis]|uniref:hypothetical protein n=1 Tax=Piscinibacter sakaiensis TaxID=1547922 RepID=UPI003AB0B7DD
MSAVVDTDPQAPDKSLILTFFAKGGNVPKLRPIAHVSGIPRATFIPIVIESFLDERENDQGGKGRERIWVNGNLVVDALGPTLTPGSGYHRWVMAQYLYRETEPSKFTRASFWQTARMIVLP